MKNFDFKNPDYLPIIEERIRRMQELQNDPSKVGALQLYYRENPWDFINDWAVTFDPRNIERGLPAKVPFVLMPKQIEWLQWAYDLWKSQRSGITDKSRDAGVSWLAMSLACTLCLFYDGMVVGFGSRKEEYVDKLDAPKSLFYKGRMFMTNLPAVFTGGWSIKKHAPHMRILFPGTGSHITGEAGDNIGRGDRSGLYFVDESAHLERPQLVDASLSATTNCRIDVSSANGLGNPFAMKRFSGKLPVFTFSWRDDLRKDDAWYEKQKTELDPIVVAQEIDIDYNASAEGVLIPSIWVAAAIDAHIKLDFTPTGINEGALDVADEGRDKCAYAAGKGILLEGLEEWSGKDSDTFASIERAFGLADQYGHDSFRYDADGMGALVKGDARVINERRASQSGRLVRVIPFRGSGAVYRPEAQDVKGRKNKDFFMNAKAQAWWALRLRFQATYRAVVEGQPYDPEDIISLSSKIPLLAKLQTELSQPTYATNGTGKIVINKIPEGMKSPNLADAVMIRYAMTSRPFNIGS